MTNSQVTNTPRAIQQAWNDGLYNLREKRGGIARGTHIEEKCMHVLGLGWKLRGSSEVKDIEIENTLYISLQGLTQEAKFLKIGQVLWEQCDEPFILKMISSLSNNTPAQSRIFQQLALKESKNFKGYFSRAMNKSMRNNNVNPNSVLNRESKQMGSNSSMNQNYKDRILNRRSSIAESNAGSKGFEKKLLKFKTNNKQIRMLANEIEMVLKTVQNDNIADIAIDLGIPVESGSNKRYLIEAIKSIVCSYVEYEILMTSVNNKNVYIRPSVEGLEVIRKLLKYTSFAVLGYDGVVSASELRTMGTNISNMKNNMAEYTKGRPGNRRLNSKKLDKHNDNRDSFIDKVKNREAKGTRGLRGANRGKKDNQRSKFKFKTKGNTGLNFYTFLFDNLSLQAGVNLTYADPGKKQKENADAVSAWINEYKTDTECALHISARPEVIDNKSTYPDSTLVFSNFNRDQLLERLISLVGSMGIEKALMPGPGEGSFTPDNPSFYMLLIIRRHLSMEKEGNVNLLSKLLFTGKKKKANLQAVKDNILGNVADSEAERKKFEKLIVKGPDGIFRPILVGEKKLKELFDEMKGVYIVGGSVHTFGSNGGPNAVGSPGEGNESKEYKEKLTKRRSRIKGYSGENGVSLALKDSLSGGDMGAFGTQQSPIARENGESDADYAIRIIQDKTITALKTLKVKPSIQPVFLVNKGINTSNIELTALMNILPGLLDSMGIFGKLAGSFMTEELMSQIDAARSLPKFAVGGSFSTRNSNVSQFISGDSINNRINPEKVTIDWKSQRVNVQPINTTNNNITNVEKGRVSDPIAGTPHTVKVSSKSGKTSEAMSVYNSVNPFDENLSAGGISASPMEVFLSIKESLVDILVTLSSSNQTGQTHAGMTAKVVDAINNLNNNMVNESGGGGANIFEPLNRLARGD